MTQRDKELLIKDLCARLPYGVKGLYYSTVISLHMVDPFDNYHPLYCVTKSGSEYIGIDEFKPYLFPLSSITEEQEKELSKLGVSYGEYALHDDIRGLGIMVDEAYIFFEFCYKHHIDFLGLIEMGLAEDATDKNIY